MSHDSETKVKFYVLEKVWYVYIKLPNNDQV